MSAVNYDKDLLMNIEVHKYRTGLEVRMLENKMLEFQAMLLSLRTKLRTEMCGAALADPRDLQQRVGAMELRIRQDQAVVSAKLFEAYEQLEKHREVYDVVRKHIVEAAPASASPAPPYMSGVSFGAPAAIDALTSYRHT